MYKSIDVLKKYIFYKLSIHCLTERMVFEHLQNAPHSYQNMCDLITFYENNVLFIDCPYTALIHGVVSERLQNVSDRLLLLDYLITELMGARVLQDKKPEKKIELKLVSI